MSVEKRVRALQSVYRLALLGAVAYLLWVQQIGAALVPAALLAIDVKGWVVTSVGTRRALARPFHAYTDARVLVDLPDTWTAEKCESDEEVHFVQFDGPGAFVTIFLYSQPIPEGSLDRVLETLLDSLAKQSRLHDAAPHHGRLAGARARGRAATGTRRDRDAPRPGRAGGACGGSRPCSGQSGRAPWPWSRPESRTFPLRRSHASSRAFGCVRNQGR